MNKNIKNQNAGNSKSPISKNAIPKKDAEIKKDAILKDDKKDEKGIDLNSLAKFADQLKGMQIKNPSMQGGKEGFLYIYPSHFNKDIINGLEGKNFRNKRRNELKSICNNIFYYSHAMDAINLQKSIDKFNEIYKMHYSKNDYSLSSLSNSNNQSNLGNIQFAVDIIKDLKGGKEEKK